MQEVITHTTTIGAVTFNHDVEGDLVHSWYIWTMIVQAEGQSFLV